MEASSVSAQRRATAELLLAGSMWGFGFVAVMWALVSFSPLEITSIRFALGGGVALLISCAVPSLRTKLRTNGWPEAKLAAFPGAMIALTLILQTWGMKYTTATKAGFITTLYVLIVPILDRWLFKKRLPKRHFLFVAIALFGTALICRLSWHQAEGSGVNLGDLLNLGCAFAASLHILWIERVSPRVQSAFLFNCFQSLWAGTVSLIAALFFDRFVFVMPTTLAIAGILFLSICSTLIAFALQIRAQRVLSGATASLLFLMESPFAAVFSFIFLGERLVSSQWIGAALIMLAVVMSVLRP